MLSVVAALTLGAPQADKVTSLPGFDDTWQKKFSVYSGYLTVPGPFEKTDYDSLKVHYQLHTSQRNASDPLVTWHQGGPGGSAIAVGLYTEMGYFQISDTGNYFNEYAWNSVANMLYLESPAGSGSEHGFSECIKGGKPVNCHWDDVSQAEAYSHSLAAFRKAFPEYDASPLVMTGESYWGQYGPNIANWILTHAPFNTSLGLSGIALGNACWGGDAATVNCNGPNEQQNDVDIFFGKALISKKLYTQTYSDCDFPLTGNPSIKCDLALQKVHAAVGPHNIYNIYDNCPLDGGDESEFDRTKRLRAELLPGATPRRALAATGDPSFTGGYQWSCGGMSATSKWLLTADVQSALHLGKPDQSQFGYTTSGPASITLYPFLIPRLRVLIYNGDADACVPYKGNEEWITDMEKQGVLNEKDAWRPWFADKKSNDAPPAGYVTTFTSKSAFDFSFATIRLAGHMVPTFQAKASLAFFSRFLAGTPM